MQLEKSGLYFVLGGFNLEMKHQVLSAEGAEEGSQGCSAAEPLNHWFKSRSPEGAAEF